MILEEIRQKATQLTKFVDDFVDEAEQKLDIKSSELDKKIKQLAVLEKKEQKLEHTANSLRKERALIEKEKKTNRLKSGRLDKRKIKLEEKIEEVNRLMNDV